MKRNRVNKKKLLVSLKKDYKAAETFRDAEDSKIAQRKKEYNGEAYGNEKKGKSAIVTRDTKKQSSWLHPTLVDPFVATPDVVKCSPVTWEDKLAAQQNELLLNTQFCRQFDRYNFMNTAVKVLDVEGTLVVQTGWEYEDKEVETEVGVVYVDEVTGEEFIEYEQMTETVIVTNKPTAKVCRNEDIYIDPTCMGDMDNCQFVIYRYETDLSTLKQDGRYKNLDKIQPDAEDAEAHEDYETERSKVSTFKFEDDPRKKMIVYEYWGNYDVNNDGVAEPVVCSWIGDTVIRLQDNPYPDKKVPFVVVPFNSIPFSVYGESNGDLISDNQKIKTAITRGLIDNMAQSNNGQTGVKKGALDTVNLKKFVAGENFQFNGNHGDIWQGNYNQIPGSAFDMLGLMNNEIESITGVKSFSGGINAGSLGGTATGARGALDATSTRRLNIVRNIAENLVKPIMRKWMSYNAEFLDEEEVIRVTNEEFVPIKRDDLEGRVDIDITISTQEDNGIKAQQLSFLLQTNAANMDPELQKLVQAEIARLYRMPDFAKRIEEFSPEPDPVQQQIQQIQLENMMLENEKIKADIADKYARAGENEVDRELKIRKAQVEAAKARKLESDADLVDLKHLKDDAGYSHLEKLELADQRHQQELDNKRADLVANMRLAEMQARNGGPDEQIGVMR